ncbi:hypothetical protein BGX27_011328 [Mortierella sp. AM989]|nr:hypothetical protein BGX27_011328 [Mortierella sp. AM989]
MNSKAKIDIPEILDVIFQYLDRRDQINCLHVSRVFYAAIIPRIWRSIVMPSSNQDKKTFPSIETLERFKPYIQALSFTEVLPGYVALRGFNQLKTLSLYNSYDDGFDTEEDIDKVTDMALIGLGGFITAHSSTLQDITIRIYGISEVETEPQTDLWRSLAQCPQLSRLELSEMWVPSESFPFFLQTCVKTKRLILANVILSTQSELQYQSIGGISNDSLDDILHTEPQELILSITDTAYIGDELNAVQGYNYGMTVRCLPRLKSLYVNGRSAEFDEIFLQELSKSPSSFPYLESLEIRRSNATDDNLAGFLKKLPRLSNLMIRYHRGPLSLFCQALQSSQACESLRYLALYRCYNVTSAVVQSVLENCPKLTSLYAKVVTMTDVARGREWACRDLSYLHVLISTRNQVDDQDPVSKEQFAEMQRLVFARLGKLTKLEHLNLTSYTAIDFTGGKTVDLRLEAGLDQLSGLVNLQSLTFGGDMEQQIGVQEVRWMVQHWQRLKHLVGTLNGDDSVIDEMKATLKASDISITKSIHIGGM